MLTDLRGGDVMSNRNDSTEKAGICSKNRKMVKQRSRRWWVRCLLPVTGFFALVWFLVRVIPKPSRATYPCQRVAFPLASGFVIWLLGLSVSALAFRKAKYYFARSRYVIACLCIAVSITAAFFAISLGNEKTVLAADPTPNIPIGVAKGANPGRVVWVHDANSTDWDGPGMGNGYWWESNNTDMAAVDRMMTRTIRSLAGESNISQAWDKLFRYFNQTHGKGDIGYQDGEKITIKVNLVGCIGAPDWSGVNPDTYDLDPAYGKMDYMNTSPQMMLALLRQLVEVVGVNESDISIGDTLCFFPNQYYNFLHDEFPDVNYLDCKGGDAEHPRTAVQWSDTRVYWSCLSYPNSYDPDFVPVSYFEADYLINMANFKSHASAAVTLCGKNHYGSLIRGPMNYQYGFSSSCYDLHTDLPEFRPGMGYYRTLVDLMGHSHIGAKTLLYLIDGLYAGHHPYDNWPTKLTPAPFNNDWSSSLFASQDPVAIDSVCFDFLWWEPGWDVDTHMSGGDDYLHEAAEANNPDSGTFYDPDHSGDVTRLESLGVHEHWNDAASKQYTRNLETGNGIELLSLKGLIPGDFDNDDDVDINDLTIFIDAWLSQKGGDSWNYVCEISETRDDVIDWKDFAAFAKNWQKGL